MAITKDSRSPWRMARHLAFLNEKLVELAERHIDRLIVQMPPRHGKSELVSRFFIAWYLLNFPHHRAIYASNTARQAAKYGRMVRALIIEHGGKYGVYISKERGAANDFELVDAEGNPLGGGLLSVGVGGQLAGRGADLLVIDDPIKDAEQAQSEVWREKTWDFWTADASTRIQPGGVVVEIQTRWHEDDLAGRLEAAMQAGGDQWEIVRFPAVAEEEDILGRQPGEALWPEMYPLDDQVNPKNQNTLSKIKIRLGPYWWSAEYQQRPAPREGALFKKVDWRYFKLAKDLDPEATLRDGPYWLLHPDREPELIQRAQGTVIVTMDMATSEKTIADYTVWVVGRILPTGQTLVLDVQREKLQGPELPDATILLKQKWEPDSVAVEKKGFQLSVIQGIWRKNVPVRELDVKGDKVGRALPASNRVAAHTVFLLQGAGWLTDFIEEHAVFNRGTHDDQVDAHAYLILEAERIGLGDEWVNLAAQQAAAIEQRKKGLL